VQVDGPNALHLFGVASAGLDEQSATTQGAAAQIRREIRIFCLEIEAHSR
jgi:hypothetical protein